jgi:hypothetical protein
MSDIKAISNACAPLGRETPRNVDLSRRFISLGAEPFVGCDAIARRRQPDTADYFQPVRTILRRMNAICVASGNCFGHTSWQASKDMQPNTPSSSPTTS